MSVKQFCLMVGALVGVCLSSQVVAENYFNSPSGNIACMGTDSGVYCTINEKNKDELSCWDEGITSFYVPSRGKSELDCSTSEYFYDESAPILAYGKTMRGNGWSCTSQKSGMTCKNNAGRGFSLSRSSQRLF